MLNFTVGPVQIQEGYIGAGKRTGSIFQNR